MSYAEIPVANIRPSPTNPRKQFDEAKLAELADSLRTKGVISPVTVRPITGIIGPKGEWIPPGSYELVCGERRWRAAKIAGLETIPASVREMGDVEVLEIQAIENDQRDDVLPSERARGYQALIDAGVPREQVAAKVGKSESWLRAVLRLGGLPETAAEALDNGELPRSTAELIARVPGEEARAKVSLCVLTHSHTPGNIIRNDVCEPLSYRETKDLIQRHFCRELKSAPFDPRDATLPPGACSTCPKMAGNAGDDYADVRADMCLDVACFADKAKLNAERSLKSAEADGFTPIVGKEAKEFFPYAYNHDRPDLRGEWVNLGEELPWDLQQRIKDATGKTVKSWRTALGKQFKDVPKHLLFSPNGNRFELAKRAGVMRLLNDLYPKKEEAKADKSPKGPSEWDIEERAVREYAEEVGDEVSGLLVDDRERATAVTLRLVVHALAVEVSRSSSRRFHPMPPTLSELVSSTPDLRPAASEPLEMASHAVGSSGIGGLMPGIAAWAAWVLADADLADEVEDLKPLTDGSFEEMRKHVEAEMVREAKEAAKAKAKKPVKSAKIPRSEAGGKDDTRKNCFRCDGCGLICNACGESESVCQGDCQGEDLAGHSDCPECQGVGKVPPASDTEKNPAKKPKAKAGAK